MKRIAAISTLMIGCATGPAESTPASNTVSEVTSTEHAHSTLEEAVGSASIVIIGEMHGNEQGPAALLEATKIALRDGPTSVGLEVEESDTAVFEAYLNSAGDDAARNALLEASFWSPQMFDGRANQALFDAMEQLRAMRAAGSDVRVFCFLRAGDFNPSDQNPHEARMAAAIVEHHKTNPHRKIVSLAGNLHAKRTPFQFSGPSVEPMAKRVLDTVPETLTVKLVYSGGATWAIGRDGLTQMPLSPSEGPDSFAPDDSGDYHALWPIGAGVPSVPAHPDALHLVDR